MGLKLSTKIEHSSIAKEFPMTDLHTVIKDEKPQNVNHLTQ